MGEKGMDLRRTAVSALCSWCGLIKVGMCWVENSSRSAAARHAERVCPGCRMDFSPKPMSRPAAAAPGSRSRPD